MAGGILTRAFPLPLSRRRRALTRAAAPYVLIASAVIIVTAVLAYPLGLLGSLSLQHYGLRQLLAHQGVWVGLQNFSDLLHDSLFGQVVLRSLAFTVVTVTISMVLATLIALLMERVAGWVRLLLSAGLIFVWATPVVVAIDIWQWMFDYEFGVANWALTRLHVGNFIHYNWFENPLQGFAVVVGLVVWGALPFLVITLYAGLMQVPQELVEAARVDGARAWQVFRAVTVPVLRPLFLILLSLSTIWDFQVFNQVWIMLNQRPSSSYYLIGIYSFVQSFRVAQYGSGAAISVVMVLILLLVTLIYVRQMARSGELG